MTVTPRRQAAQIMVLFALALTGMVALVALVLDGGNIYLQHRTAQAAADAAALAGTNALRSADNTTPLNRLADAVTTYASMNAFGPAPVVTCATFIDANGTSVGGRISPSSGVVSPDCPSTVATSIPQSAAGVHVEVHIAFPPYLIGMLQNVCGTFCGSPTADARASAMVGVLTAYDTRNAPIIVCGGGTTGNFAARLTTQTPVVATTTPGVLAATPASLPNPKDPDTTDDTLLVTPSTTPGPRFIPNAAKDGTIYYIKGQKLGQNDANCSDSGFKGEADSAQPTPYIQDIMSTATPATIQGDTGNRVPQVAQAVATAGGCSTQVTWEAGKPGCVMILPIADNSDGNTFYIGAWGAFYVWCINDTGTGCQEYTGQYLANWPISGGPASNMWTFGARGGVTTVHLTQ
jgi:Flp pilus assembly protein TadG